MQYRIETKVGGSRSECESYYLYPNRPGVAVTWSRTSSYDEDGDRNGKLCLHEGPRILSPAVRCSHSSRGMCCSGRYLLRLSDQACSIAQKCMTDHQLPRLVISRPSLSISACHPPAKADIVNKVLLLLRLQNLLYFGQIQPSHFSLLSDLISCGKHSVISVEDKPSPLIILY